MPELANMSLEELTDMTADLQALTSVGENLSDQGFNPRFEFRPGAGVAIYLDDVVIPDVYARAPVVRADYMDPRQNYQSAEPAPPPAGETEGGGVGPGPAATQEQNDGTPAAAAAEAEPSPGDGPGVPAEPPAASAAPVATPSQLEQHLTDQLAAAAGPAVASEALRAPTPDAGKPSSWTEEEDFLAVNIAAAAIGEGLTWSAIANEIGHRLGRPAEGVKWRLRNKLDARIQARAREMKQELDRALTHIPAPKLTPQEDTALQDLAAKITPADPAPAAPVFTTPPPEFSGRAKHLWASLDVIVTRKWPAAAEAELVQSVGRGERLDEIARDMGRKPEDVRDRWNTLKALAEDAMGRPGIDAQRLLTEVVRARAAGAVAGKAA